MPITAEILAERREELGSQMAQAEGHVARLQSELAKARNTVEAIYGAIQETEAWQKRLESEPSPNGTNRIAEEANVE